MHESRDLFFFFTTYTVLHMFMQLLFCAHYEKKFTKLMSFGINYSKASFYAIIVS